MLSVIRFVFNLGGFVLEILLAAVVGQGGDPRSRRAPAPPALPPPFDPTARVEARRVDGPLRYPPESNAPHGGADEAPDPSVTAWVRSVAPPPPRAAGPAEPAVPTADTALGRLEARRQGVKCETFPTAQIKVARPAAKVDVSLVTALVKLGFRKADAESRLTRAASELPDGSDAVTVLRRALSLKTL